MKNKRNFQKNNAITLIALVVTIVVLLILAGVSIAMLTGENGIIQQAQSTKGKTEQAKLEELVKLAINGLLAENKGNKNLITPEMIADRINKDENRTDVKAEGTTFPTNIIFEEEGKKVEVDIDLSIKEGTGEVPETEDTTIFSNVEGISEEELVAEANENIDMFEYEIIDTAEVGATELESLPTKTARITRIKEIYCNHIASDEPLYDENNNEYADTNYEIIYRGEKITDTLVVPYQVEIDGEMYKITEAFLGVRYEEDDAAGYALPRVETIIYPNTIEIIPGVNMDESFGLEPNPKIKTIILPENLKMIDKFSFIKCEKLTNIIIPKTVTSIGEQAFFGCTGLTSIIIPESVRNIGEYAFADCERLISITILEGVTSIEDSTFYGCKGLTSITLPSSITSIGGAAFSNCIGLTSITISGNVIDIGDYAFSDCTGLKSVTIQEGVKNIGSNAFRECSELTSIIIPNSVASIGGSAFYNCMKLKEVYFKQTTPPIFGTNCFSSRTNKQTATYYFKNSTVADAFTTEYYKQANGEKSPDYNW